MCLLYNLHGHGRVEMGRRQAHHRSGGRLFGITISRHQVFGRDCHTTRGRTKRCRHLSPTELRRLPRVALLDLLSDDDRAVRHSGCSAESAPAADWWIVSSASLGWRSRKRSMMTGTLMIKCYCLTSRYQAPRIKRPDRCAVPLRITNVLTTVDSPKIRAKSANNSTNS